MPHRARGNFTQKGIRDRIAISLVTPYTGAFTKPNANRVLSRVAEAKGIEVVPNFAMSAVDAERKVVRTFDGRTVDYDLICDTLQTAVELMDANRIKRLVVADPDRRVQGLVSRADLIKLFAMK